VTFAVAELIETANVWAGLPVAVVVIILALVGWRLLSTGALVYREQHVAIVTEIREQHVAIVTEIREQHAAVVTELREQHAAVVAELREQIDTADRHRAEALTEVARWQGVALRLLNVSEAAVSRREET